jgi:diguanylate cyclase (GGDEF)-like protein
MAASDPHQHSHRLLTDGGDALGPAQLSERLQEEIARAERHGTGLSCLLVVFDELDQIASEHGGELRSQTIEYVAGALRRELRSFDRVGYAAEGDVLLLLPGADSPRGEIVARRAIERLRTIKVESAGTRLALQVSVGLAAWREGMSARELLASARAALRSVNGERAPGPMTAPGAVDAGVREPAPSEGEQANPASGRSSAE